MALFPTLSNATPFRYPISRTPTQRAGVHVFCDFSEVRYIRGSAPLTEFKLQYNRISKADKETLRSFYDSQGGEYGLGWQLLFESTLYKSCQFIGPFAAVCVGPNLWQVSLEIRAIGGANASGSFNGGTVALPSGLPITATLFILTSHILGTPYSGGGCCSTNGLSFFSRGWMDDYSGWTLRTNSTSVDPISIYGGLDVLFAITALDRPGVANTVPDQFLIYDCWLNVAYADGTTAALRPTSAVAASTALLDSGTVANPGNAIDGSQSSYALISYPQVDYLSWSVALRLSNFQ